MRAALWFVVITGSLAVTSAASAAGDFLGAFRPVAGEEGARALWVNPAAIGTNGTPAAAADLVWYGDDDFRFSDARRLSVAVSTLRSAYGIQWDLANETGVPDWTVALGKKIPVAQLVLGFNAEWRGGEDGALDGAVGAVVPAGRELKLAVAGTHLFEPETDGVKARQKWQAGAAYRPAALLGHLTYDAVFQSGEDEHWFGLAFDRTRPLRFGGAVDVDGNWSLTASVVFGANAAGGGAHEPNGGPRREFVAWDWSGETRQVRRSPRGIGR